MTEFVASIVSQAIQTASDLLFCQAVSLASVREDVRRLQAEQTRIQCFLRDADRCHDHADERVRNWISEVRDVSCDVDDLVEASSSSPGGGGFMIFHLRRIRTWIDSVRTKMEDILRSKQTYGIEFGSGGGGTGLVAADDLQRGLRRSCPNDNDDDVIGLKDGAAAVEALMSQLMAVDDQLRVVSVVGMGGLGKTTLAKMVYNHPKVRLHFDCFAWVYVSQKYIAKDILSEISVQIGFGARLRSSDLEEKRNRREILRKMEEHDLVESIKTELREMRYLVVLDDIWRIQAWDAIKTAFPRGKRGSKVLFTTRNKEIASFADPLAHPIEPSLLRFEESLELLRRKAFPCTCVFPPGFDKLGKEMAKKCAGLPLAVAVLGGLLSTKRSIEEWRSVEGDVISYINKYRSGQQYDGVNGILALSYYDLPYCLKPCFLYLSSFPEDMEIPKETLIELWIAEGFVSVRASGSEDEAEETIAEQYLQELVDRCMFQVSKRNDSGIGVKTYRIHDLMRELCVSKARDENFLEVIHRRDTENSSVAAICARRIAVHPGCEFDRYRSVRPHLRSLLCFEINGFPSSCLIGESFSLLRSLELGFNRFKVTFEILKQICNLRHLRYLGLRDTGINKLPDSISNLRRLRTIDLRDNREIWTLPSAISRLTRLKRLLISTLRLNRNSSWTRSTVFRMNNLRYFSLGNHKTWIRYDSLVKLSSLQNLKIELTSAEEVTALLESPVIKSGQLRSLDMEIPPGHTFPLSLRLLSRCRNLSTLRLQGRLENDNICSSVSRGLNSGFIPLSIAKLTLKYSCLDQDPMVVLERLPNLRLLRLSDEAYTGSKMLCTANRFPRLETLQLCHLSSLKEWLVEKDSMPSLKRLYIQDNQALRMVPEGLRFVATLGRIEIVDMAKSFQDRLRVNKDGIEGEDYGKFCHVSSISFINTLESYVERFSWNDF